MKKFLIYFLFSALVYAQEGSGSNAAVELPEFVITGQNINTLQQTKKPEAEMIPVVSPNFFRPPISPETPEIKQMTGPESSNLSLRDTLNINNGRIKTMLGVYTLPMADVFISSPFQTGLLNGYLNGKNLRPYDDNTERYFLNAGLNYTIFSDYQSSFLPGSEFNLKGNFNSKSYKLYAGDPPLFKRNLYQGSFGGSVKNIYFSKFMAGLSGDFKSTSISNEKYSENLFSAGGFIKSNLGSINFGLTAQYYNLSFKDSSGSGNIPDFVELKPFVGFDFSRLIKASFGINYTKSGSSNFLVPFASVGFRLSNEFSVFGEYAPTGEFITSSALVEQNMYFSLQDVPALYVKKSHDLKAVLKYEYGRYFEINGGFRLKAYKDLPYFSEMLPNGTFSILSAKSDYIGWFVNLLFNRGPYGYFYGSIDAGNMKNPENQVVPYFPSLLSSLTYGYEFPFGLNAETNLVYRSEVYTNITNSDKLPAYVNLNFNISYGITQNLKLLVSVNNIVNKENYIWNNYKETPADFLAGISYSW